MTDRCQNIISNGAGGISRLRMTVNGLVQGVGFRPFVYRLATEMGLSGWVRNSAQGVAIEVEGLDDKLQEFTRRLETEKPPRSEIIDLDRFILKPRGYSGFAVHGSVPAGEKTAIILPDIATCPECVREIFDPTDRRYRYPFTNCTDCGPRFSILESLPYDRAGTTMKVFPLCDQCREEYENPANRRFHAQPNACPHCGPHLELWDHSGRILATHDKALIDTCTRIAEGQIVALKGLGGFQILVDARHDEALRRLRRRKSRKEKPFALMSPDLNTVRNQCVLSSIEEQLLVSTEAPIVLVKRRLASDGADSLMSRFIAPDNPYFGVMLPYTPLHHLLMAELQSPIVATSGNLADEPICIAEEEALCRLRGIADCFLVHNRPIARQMDDSIVQVVAGKPMTLRAARGYAPLTKPCFRPGMKALAVGAHLKNMVAVSNGHHVILSQHLADLTTKRAHEVFRREADALPAIYKFEPETVCCDEHPDYHSTRFAAHRGLPVTRVQHHLAHTLACIAEHHLDLPALGVSWDGTGRGRDGTVWGGEFLRVTESGVERLAHFQPFPLPGGEQAVREPRRSAAGLLYEIFGKKLSTIKHLATCKAFSAPEQEILVKMIKQKLNSPRTSSVGRLFDAVASITGICQTASFEGQAAMKLQFAAETDNTTAAYDYCVHDECIPYVVDWQPIIQGILHDLDASVPISRIAAKFHRTLAETILAVADRTGLERVAISGGCFQNKLLTEWSISALRKAGFAPYWPQGVPPNDGGIALGQIFAATRRRMTWEE